MTRHTLLDMDFTNMCDPIPVLCPSDNQRYEASACAPNDSPGSSNPPRTVSSKEAPSSNLEATILHQLSTVVEQLELQRKRIVEIAATKTSPDSVNNMSNSEQVVNTNGAGYVVGGISGDFAAKLFDRFDNLSKEMELYRSEVFDVKTCLKQGVSAGGGYNKSNNVTFGPNSGEYNFVPSVTSTPNTRGDVSGSVCRKPVRTLQAYDGSTSFMDYNCHFQLCAQLNNWSENEMALHLATSLKGSAQKVLTSLKVEDRLIYSKVIGALEDRFLPQNQCQLYRAQLKARQRKPKESLPELGEAVRRLVTMSYPSADSELLQILAKDAFCDALCDDGDMVWQIQRTRPTNVEDAVRLAVELEANQSPGNTNNYNTSRGATNGNGSASFRIQRYDHNNRWHYARSGHGSRANKRTFCTPNETGLHIKSIIQSVNVNALIDTGATISFLSKKSFDSIPRNNRPELKYVAARYSTANGGLMVIYGKADFLIEIYGHNYPHTLVVADIGSQCILGLDFMNANEGTINLKRKTITLNGNTYEIHLEEPIGICRVSLCENTCVPSGHEVVVNGYIPLECVELVKYRDVMMEPIERLYKEKRILSAKAICYINDDNPWVPVRLFNANDYDVFFYKNTSVGDLVPVRVVETERVSQTPNICPELPPHVLDLWVRACEGRKQVVHVDRLRIYNQRDEESDSDAPCEPIDDFLDSDDNVDADRDASCEPIDDSPDSDYCDSNVGGDNAESLNVQGFAPVTSRYERVRRQPAYLDTYVMCVSSIPRKLGEDDEKKKHDNRKMGERKKDDEKKKDDERKKDEKKKGGDRKKDERKKDVGKKDDERRQDYQNDDQVVEKKLDKKDGAKKKDDYKTKDDSDIDDGKKANREIDDEKRVDEDIDGGDKDDSDGEDKRFRMEDKGGLLRMIRLDKELGGAPNLNFSLYSDISEESSAGGDSLETSGDGEEVEEKEGGKVDRATETKVETGETGTQCCMVRYKKIVEVESMTEDGESRTVRVETDFLAI
ncbi:hypothetical protein LOTGIDRAFT_155939 [Lottia gigantea]|uniref:Peptidase A2 domain-containing protein n=1 Tax=Lottia gigantea TaxID=225164 RepID=V3ZFN5_LOTGI|nr:hypothetical protein LOTGIDRAFT_155939 [Lottia gigantea]ESO82897.1 hypothetical protein LOTGIDRAFT_155939 [Lottia gigantea]